MKGDSSNMFNLIQRINGKLIPFIECLKNEKFVKNKLYINQTSPENLIKYLWFEKMIKLFNELRTEFGQYKFENDILLSLLPIQIILSGKNLEMETLNQ